MTILNLNKHPRAIPYISSILPGGENVYTIADVGARGGIAPMWKPLTQWANFIGFDPDENECANLNRLFDRVTFYPVALHDHDGEDKFCVTRSPFCHGHFGVNKSYYGRFPSYPINEVLNEQTMKYNTFDKFADQYELGHVDFIKIDTEGSELAVLRGAKGSLESRQVIGVLSELWWDPHIKNQPSFAEMDIFLREAGFFLFDIVTHRYPRSTLPIGHLVLSKIEGTLHVSAPKWNEHGQILTGDALYLRDPIVDLSGPNPSPFKWDDVSILKMIALLDMFNYSDAAIELAGFYRSRFVVPVDVDALLDLLVPVLETEDGTEIILTFDEYHQWSRRVYMDRTPMPLHIQKEASEKTPPGQ